jgi:hypothetical protein
MKAFYIQTLKRFIMAVEEDSDLAPLVKKKAGKVRPYMPGSSDE